MGGLNLFLVARTHCLEFTIENMRMIETDSSHPECSSQCNAKKEQEVCQFSSNNFKIVMLRDGHNAIARRNSFASSEISSELSKPLGEFFTVHSIFF